MICSRPNIDLDGLYSGGQAAKALGCSDETIRRARIDGYLKVASYRRSIALYLGRDLIALWAGRC